MSQSIRILPVSDVHLEFCSDGGNARVQALPEAEVIVVAGDLTNAKGLAGALKMLSRKYPDVVYIPGNHEYYGGSKVMIEAIKEARPNNVHWIDRDTVTLYGQRYVGATLWFPDTNEARENVRWINDFHHIRGTNWIWEEFEKSRSFLAETILPTDIVVTHHLPTPKSVSERFQKSRLNCYFLADVSELVTSKWWIHGHTHDPCDYMHGATRVLCNPMGYPGERTWRPVWIQ